MKASRLTQVLRTLRSSAPSPSKPAGAAAGRTVGYHGKEHPFSADHTVSRSTPADKTFPSMSIDAVAKLDPVLASQLREVAKTSSGDFLVTRQHIDAVIKKFPKAERRQAYYDVGRQFRAGLPSRSVPESVGLLAATTTGTAVVVGAWIAPSLAVVAFPVAVLACAGYGYLLWRDAQAEQSKFDRKLHAFAPWVDGREARSGAPFSELSDLFYSESE